MEKLKTLLILFFGGGLGTLLRFGATKLANPIAPYFYWGTFSVNIIGSLLLGFIVGMGFKNPSIATENWFIFISIGLCGGFTTFSTFALENQELLKTGHYLDFIIYLTASVVLGIFSIGLGFWLSKLT